MNALTSANYSGEVRLLYVLLDAIACSGLITDPALSQRVAETKRRTELAGFEAEGRTLFELLTHLDENGAMTGTWMRQRWLTLKARIVRGLDPR